MQTGFEKTYKYETVLDNLLTKIFKIRNQGKKLVDFYRSMLINSSHNHRSLMLQLNRQSEKT